MPSGVMCNITPKLCSLEFRFMHFFAIFHLEITIQKNAMRVSVLIIMGGVTMINERVLAELPGIIASSIFIWHISDRSNSALNSASIDSTKCGPRAKNNTIPRKK